MNVIIVCIMESMGNMVEEILEFRLFKNVVIVYDGSEYVKNVVKCEYFLKYFINRIYVLFVLLWI